MDTDIIYVISDGEEVEYSSLVWGILSQQEYVNYLSNNRNAGRVMWIEPVERINGVIRLAIKVR